MKVSLLKISRGKDVIKRIELSELAEMIRKSPLYKPKEQIVVSV